MRTAQVAARAVKFCDRPPAARNTLADERRVVTMLTDRDCIIAVFKAICGLAERLTNERMTVHLESEGGQCIAISGVGVTWSESPVSQKDHLDASDLPEELLTTRAA
jgi:hypothetical protein